MQNKYCCTALKYHKEIMEIGLLSSLAFNKER